MKIKINSHATTVKPSIIREMKVLADSYKNVIDFTLGEPHISHPNIKGINPNRNKAKTAYNIP